MQLRMGAHDVIAFHEGLHRELPVGRQHCRIPPVHLELVGIAGIHPLDNRPHAVEQRGRVIVKVDEGAADPQLHPARFEVDFRVIEQFSRENLFAEHKSVLAFGIPAPAMERADEAAFGAVARAARQPHAAVAAGVVEGLDAALGVDDDYRLFEDSVFDKVPHIGDFLKPASHLPDMRPQLFVLELEELFVVIAFRRDQFRIGYPQRDRLRRVGHIRCHDWPHPKLFLPL